MMVTEALSVSLFNLNMGKMKNIFFILPILNIIDIILDVLLVFLPNSHKSAYNMSEHSVVKIEQIGERYGDWQDK